MNAVMHMRAQTELATIYEISKILTSSLDVSKTCREALNVLANNMGYRRCMIIVDTEEGELHLLAAVGLSPEEYDAGHYRPGEGIIGKVYSNGMPAVVHDLPPSPSSSTGQVPLIISTGSASLWRQCPSVSPRKWSG
jgi:Nif-specific regulatory protein